MVASVLLRVIARPKPCRKRRILRANTTIIPQTRRKVSRFQPAYAVCFPVFLCLEGNIAPPLAFSLGVSCAACAPTARRAHPSLPSPFGGRWHTLTGLPKSIEELFGKRSGRRWGKAANEVRRQPKRLAGDEEEGRLHFAASCAAFATPPAPSCHPAVARYCRAYRRGFRFLSS